MTTKTKDEAEQTESKEEKAAAKEEKPPVWRYFSVSAELQLATLDQNVSAESIEAAVKEQVILPATISVQGAQQVTVNGVTSGGVSESSKPTKHDDGYGREAPPEDEE